MAGKPMTLGEFKVALDDLHNAAIEIGIKKKSIMDSMDGIRTCFAAFEEDWHAPAQVTFHEVQQWFDRGYRHLDSILGDIIARLQKAYDNYHDAEIANVVNLSMKGKHRDDSSQKAHKEAAVSPLKYDDNQHSNSQLRLKDKMGPPPAPKHDEHVDAQWLLPRFAEREEGNM
jgi:uncharacterized protein YukE